MSDQEQTISMEVLKKAMQAARDVILGSPTIAIRNNYLTSDEYTSDTDAYDQKIGKRFKKIWSPLPRIIKMDIKYGYDEEEKEKEEEEEDEEEEEEEEEVEEAEEAEEVEEVEEKKEKEEEEDSDRTPPPPFKKYKF